MKGKTHVGVGILTLIIICNIIAIKLNFIGISVVTIGSLLPDIDHPKSMINKYILPFRNSTSKSIVYGCIGGVLIWYSFINNYESYILSLGIVSILIAFSSHRKGLIHSLMGLILFSLIVGHTANMYNLNNVTYYFMIGYGMHLIADMGTNRGVPLLYPISNRYYKLPITFKMNSKTGNMVEDFIVLIGIIYMIYELPKMIL